MDSIIAVDIGGTYIRCALFPFVNGEYTRHNKIRTQNPDDPTEKPIDRIITCIRSIWPEKGKVLGICAAAPGSTSVNDGVVLLAPNIPRWKNIPLGRTIENAFSVKTLVNNDARMAAYGEWKKGAGIGHTNLIYFTISTGVGGGIIVDGKLLHGDIGIATEVGHIILHDKGARCGCGKMGHLEAYSSGTAIENYVRKKIDSGEDRSGFFKTASPKASEIAIAAKDGNPFAIEAFKRAGYYLGIGLANYLHIFNPSCVIFGGGVSQSGNILFKPMHASLEEHVLNKRYLDDLTISTVELGDNAGLIGCAEYLRDHLH